MSWKNLERKGIPLGSPLLSKHFSRIDRDLQQASAAEFAHPAVTCSDVRSSAVNGSDSLILQRPSYHTSCLLIGHPMNALITRGEVPILGNRHRGFGPVRRGRRDSGRVEPGGYRTGNPTRLFDHSREVVGHAA